jgi:hypothetical protein
MQLHMTRSIAKSEHFYARAHNNFLDALVILWCKIFADKKAKHYSAGVVSDGERFKNELLAHLNMSDTEFAEYEKLMRGVRDKFIAHLDDLTAVPVPKFDPALDSVKFLLDYLFRHENKGKILEGVPRFPDPVYRLAYEDAHFAYTGKPKVIYTGGREPAHDEQ